MTGPESKSKPLYLQIYESLKSKIYSSAYSAGDVLPSERQLMVHYKVERITIRKALELLVNDGLVEKIAGYGTKVKDYSLLSNKKQRGNILFFLPEKKDQEKIFSRPFNAILLSTIENECKKKDYSLIYSTLSADDDLMSKVKKNQASGIIFVSNIDKNQLEVAQRMEIPNVLVNNYYKGFPSVVMDSEKGAFFATNHLVELGHTHIAFIGGLQGYITHNERLCGYKQALYEAGINWREQIIEYGNWTYDGGYDAMVRILKNSESMPSAVFVANDIMAFGAIQAIRDNGIDVPNDISVAGFDDIENQMYFSEKLTTIRVNINSIAVIACQTLFNIIKTGKALDMKIVIPVELIVRNSTKQRNV